MKTELVVQSDERVGAAERALFWRPRASYGGSIRACDKWGGLGKKRGKRGHERAAQGQRK